MGTNTTSLFGDSKYEENRYSKRKREKLNTSIHGISSVNNGVMCRDISNTRFGFFIKFHHIQCVSNFD